MITFDEAYKSVETALRDLEADVRIISVRPFVDGSALLLMDGYLNIKI